jgi:radical SAM superfamily enzyme YgiQ (UPF0313 family)
MKRKKVLLVGRYYIIEPLGIIYLLGIPEQLGWDAEVLLIKDSDFGSLWETAESFDLIGFSIWTGYHLQAFSACDRLRALGKKVIIGGPHATYFTDDCAKHADYVIKGEGFRMFRQILAGETGEGSHFDAVRLAEGFPIPNTGRDIVYRRYPELGESPIKSLFCSLGCPFTCSYCYAPKYNEMYGGFRLNVRPVDEIINEARHVMQYYPETKMFYMQDDIFGYDMKWLKEFSDRWPREIGVPWHCQIRLELTKNEERLDLFVKGGCSGITLAIESGNDFLRRFVLLRRMEDDLIVEGIRKIQTRGMTLRTEQILAVPFSNIETDLQTLELNCRLNPEMAWTSILAPYGGTEMGNIASRFGFYRGNNDDLSETFFDQSVLRHSVNGREMIEPIAREKQKKFNDSPLLRMSAKEKNGGCRADIFGDHGTDMDTGKPLCEIQYMSKSENDRYCAQTVALQRIFNWLSKVPNGHSLGKKWVNLAESEWTWEHLGKLTKTHLAEYGFREEAERSSCLLARELGYESPNRCPKPIASNPWYFLFFPGSAEFAKHLLELGVFEKETENERWDEIGKHARRWLFMRSLYKIHPTSSPLFGRSEQK